VSGTHRLIVRWEDALPIRQALGKTGVESANPDGSSDYAVAVVLPRTAADGLDDWTNARASLKAAGNAACVFAQVRTEKLSDGTRLVIFLFPKTLEIGEPRTFRLPLLTVHSRSIAFEARTGTVTIKQSFPLQNLFYFGNFEL
jgi:hypothetical protein